MKQEAAAQKLRTSVEKSFTQPTIPPQPTQTCTDVPVDLLKIGMESETILSLLGEPTYKNQLEDYIGQIFELWIYVYDNGNEKHLYFKNNILLKIECK